MRTSEIIGPKQVVVVSCRDNLKHKLKDNLITLAWHSQLSFKPLLYGIFVGKTRYSHDMIKKSGCFCINFLPLKLKQFAIDCGTVSGKNFDKTELINKYGLKKKECKAIDCFKLDKALAWFECKLVKTVKTGDHTLFVGKVVDAKINPAYKNINKIKRLMHITKDMFKGC
jgi:flavin reductase (DIM6/NTAB) family NADH-FMN oxidoreductase RutF